MFAKISRESNMFGYGTFVYGVSFSKYGLLFEVWLLTVD
jgi:hypothetical protein